MEQLASQEGVSSTELVQIWGVAFFLGGGGILVACTFFLIWKYSPICFYQILVICPDVYGVTFSNTQTMLSQDACNFKATTSKVRSLPIAPECYSDELLWWQSH